MLLRSWRLRILDIIERIDLIHEFISDKSKDDYLKDRKSQMATARCYSVIGEAANHVPTEICQKYTKVEWRKLRDFKYLLSHEYFRVEQEMLWGTATRRLPGVKTQLQKILSADFVAD